ncbi:MAG: hypothetical protein WAM82_00390 [Thermoanaerobaculia bacterium]
MPIFVLICSLTGLAGEAGADPPGPRCDKKRAEPAFISGMEQYGRQQWEAAIPGLSKAADLCPMPNGPWVVQIFDFGGSDYVPFYYLGRCHYKLNDTENSFSALRHFYLSSCLDEPKRHGDTTRDLSSLTSECRRSIAAKRQPQQHPPEFNEGLKAFEHDWGKAAENMWDALQIETDDGQMKPSGRWPDPYLPGLRLAKALIELGCVQEACAQYDRFQFKDLLAKDDKTRFQAERQMMAKLSAECAGKNRERSADNETCQRWRCWVGEGRP